MQKTLRFRGKMYRNVNEKIITCSGDEMLRGEARQDSGSGFTKKKKVG